MVVLVVGVEGVHCVRSSVSHLLSPHKQHIYIICLLLLVFAAGGSLRGVNVVALPIFSFLKIIPPKRTH